MGTRLYLTGISGACRIAATACQKKPRTHWVGLLDPVEKASDLLGLAFFLVEKTPYPAGKAADPLDTGRNPVEKSPDPLGRGRDPVGKSADPMGWGSGTESLFVDPYCTIDSVYVRLWTVAGGGVLRRDESSEVNVGSF